MENIKINKGKKVFIAHLFFINFLIISNLELFFFSEKVNIQKNEVKLFNMSQSIMHSPYINNSTIENWFTAFLQSPQWKNAHKTRKNYLFISIS